MNLGKDDSTGRCYQKTSRWEMETGQTAYKRKLAYRRLGINPKDVQCIPFLAAQLRRIARTARCVDTHNPDAPPCRPLDYLRFSEDPEARKVLEVYDSVPESYRRLLRPEDFCHAAGVSPWRVLEIITVVAVRNAGQACAIVSSILQPRVVAKIVERALQDDGMKECVLLSKATGFLPYSGLDNRGGRVPFGSRPERDGATQATLPSSSFQPK
jgi:hypothetical protein